MQCPSLDDITDALSALLPRGRAWQSHEIGPQRGSEIGFNPSAFNPDAFSASFRPTSTLWKYWRSFAVVLHYLTQRLCALRMEFWCASVNETRDGWMAEYGLPDNCDPFPDLCAKVAAIGGTRCEYYAAIASKAGWSIQCLELAASCGSKAGCARAGNAKAGAMLGQAQIRIVVHLSESAAYLGGRFLTPFAGRLRAGRRLTCGPNIEPLRCLLSRVVHAEIQTIYEATYG